MVCNKHDTGGSGEYCGVSEVCNEHGIGSSGEYCGVSDTHLGGINVFYHEASGGKYVPRGVLFDLEPSMIGAVTLNRRSANSLVWTTS